MSRRTVGLTLLNLAGVLVICGALYDLLVPSVPPNHGAYLGTTVEQIDPRYAELDLAMLRSIGGGLLAIGVTTLVLTNGPIRRGEAWACVTVAVLVGVSEGNNAYRMYPFGSPWYGPLAFAVLAVTGAVLVGAGLRTAAVARGVEVFNGRIDMGTVFRSLPNWQLVACLLGILAGFVPGVSFTGQFYGLSYVSGGWGASADGKGVRVTDVQADSPVFKAGFRSGDLIRTPATFDEVEATLAGVDRGEKHAFTVQRGETELMIEAARPEPELAAVWYADIWYPVAGGIFLVLGVLVFATAPLTPPPWWRSVPLVFAGLGMATGFVVQMATGSVFARLRIYQRWPMGVGDEWSLPQGLIGIAAGVLLMLFAAAEIRHRLAQSVSAHHSE